MRAQVRLEAGSYHFTQQCQMTTILSAGIRACATRSGCNCGVFPKTKEEMKPNICEEIFLSCPVPVFLGADRQCAVVWVMPCRSPGDTFHITVYVYGTIQDSIVYIWASGIWLLCYRVELVERYKHTISMCLIHKYFLVEIDTHHLN